MENFSVYMARNEKRCGNRYDKQGFFKQRKETNVALYVACFHK